MKELSPENADWIHTLAVPDMLGCVSLFCHSIKSNLVPAVYQTNG
jgi:hypothetical protein